MTNRRFAHALARWSVLAGLLVAAFWGVWMQFAPLPMYFKPWEHSRLWWLDAALMVIVVNMAGWTIRWIGKSDSPKSDGTLIGAILGGIVSGVPGSFVGRFVGEVLGGDFGAAAGGFVGGAFAAGIGFVFYRIVIRVFGVMVCWFVGGTVGVLSGGDVGGFVGVFIGVSVGMFIGERIGRGIQRVGRLLLNFLNARNIT